MHSVPSSGMRRTQTEPGLLQQEILNVANTCGIPAFRYVFFAKPAAFFGAAVDTSMSHEERPAPPAETGMDATAPMLFAIPDPVAAPETPVISSLHRPLQNQPPGPAIERAVAPPAAALRGRLSRPEGLGPAQAKPRYALLTEVTDALAPPSARPGRTRPMGID